MNQEPKRHAFEMDIPQMTLLSLKNKIFRFNESALTQSASEQGVSLDFPCQHLSL